MIANLGKRTNAAGLGGQRLHDEAVVAIHIPQDWELISRIKDRQSCEVSGVVIGCMRKLRRLQ